MKRIIIFRFDRKPKMCANHLSLLKKLNPQIPIYGIYGGNKKDYSTCKKQLGPYLESIYFIKNKPSLWKWMNFDLALRDWYKSLASKIDFDIAYVIEWDLVLTAPIKEVYSHINANDVGLTGLIKLKLVEKGWSWTSKEPYKTEWRNLLAFAKKKYRYSKQPNASVGPGLCFPKIFLKKYSEAEVPELAHDELRVPLYAQIFGLKCKDTKIRKAGPEKHEQEFFNCARKKIKIKTILREMKKKNGRRAFHPVRDFVKID